MQFWFPTLCLHSWRSYNGCIAHGTLGVSAGCCCCCCLQFVVMVNVLTMTPLIILPRVWAGWGLREKLGLLGKNDLVCSQGWFQPLDRKLAAILRRRQRLWLALYWESQRWVSLARSPQATLRYVCVCACIRVHAWVCVCVLRRVTSAPRWVARGGGVGEWLWLQCPSSAAIRALIQPDPPHVLTHTPLHLSQVFIFILTK